MCNKIAIKSVTILYSARGQDKGFYSVRRMDLGLWFTQSSLSIYGDDHVIDNKSQYNCHALMITL